MSENHESTSAREPIDADSTSTEEESPIDDDTEDNELLTKNGLPPLPEGGPAEGPAPLP